MANQKQIIRAYPVEDIKAPEDIRDLKGCYGRCWMCRISFCNFRDSKLNKLANPVDIQAENIKISSNGHDAQDSGMDRAEEQIRKEKEEMFNNGYCPNIKTGVPCSVCGFKDKCVEKRIPFNEEEEDVNESRDRKMNPPKDPESWAEAFHKIIKRTQCNDEFLDDYLDWLQSQGKKPKDASVEGYAEFVNASQ